VLTAQVVLPGLPSSVPTARHFVESVLTAWGDPATAWTGALLVSELATNCTLHARTEFTVRVSQTLDRVLIEVQDASPRIPRPRSYGVQATTGRGLQLVESLGAEWGVTPTADGKTVWVELGASPGDDDELVDGPGEIELDVDKVLASFPDESSGPVARHCPAA
jgi:anti-sigma regulatory factor (Ser/Thr protein kinase)